MKKLFKYLLKIILLATCAGVCLSIFIVTYAISIDPQFFFESWRWKHASGIIIFFLVGFFFGIVFGTPFLLITDIYFPNAKGRYIFGGAIGALLVWIGMAATGPSRTPFLALASGPLNWPFSIVFMSVGASTGMLYTLALWIFDKINNEK